jgi:hypothetical protein
VVSIGVAERCASGSRSCGESPHGTASRARRWVLLEQPGAWGRDALDVSDLPAPVATQLRRLAASLPARVLLLRRPAGVARPGTVRTLFAGVSSPTGGWLEQFELGHVEELLDLDLSGLSDGATVGGDRIADPLYLVCTNGKHDPCCAEYGLPVAKELASIFPDRVWECSHVGGDRFAGNLVCLPDGLFYGHLDPVSARSVVGAHEGGRLVLDHWRGRSAIPFAAQAAEALVRRELGVERLDGLRVTGVVSDGPRHEVRLVDGAGGALTAVVTVDRSATARMLTCAGPQAVAPAYTLESLRRGRHE